MVYILCFLHDGSAIMVWFANRLYSSLWLMVLKKFQYSRMSSICDLYCTLDRPFIQIDYNLDNLAEGGYRMFSTVLMCQLIDWIWLYRYLIYCCEAIVYSNTYHSNHLLQWTEQNVTFSKSNFPFNLNIRENNRQVKSYLINRCCLHNLIVITCFGWFYLIWGENTHI